MPADPFTIAVPDAEITDLRDRLARTVWPSTIADAGWDYGTDDAFLRELVTYWRDAFDWRAQESALNAMGHYRTTAGGLELHYTHAPGRGPAPMPLVLTHGWPSTFYEMHKLIPRLTDPAAFGGDPADAFDVVVPSLPGYGFSGIPVVRGIGPRQIAAAWADLMGQLGYTRFGAHGGDWGAAVTGFLGLDHPERMAGIHTTMLSLLPQRPDSAVTDTDRERARMRADWETRETGYARIQASKPQTLAYALTDSPAGLASWIVEKWRAWSDCDGDITRRFTSDELLTTVSIYWFTRTIHSSMRLYYESRVQGFQMEEGQRIEVPTGFTFFPTERRVSRRRAEATYNIVHWTEMPRGGHFPAMEEPDLLADELRAFFRPLR